MQKPLTLSIALCLSLTGCQVFEKSPTWETVMSVRPGDSFREPDPSSSYADKLHRVLLDQGVEHYVVIYQYHYYTHQYDEALSTRTAVVYRDNADGRYPWWLKDDRTNAPVWLPNGNLDKQLSFYARRKAEVIDQKFYPAHGSSGKAISRVRTVPAPHQRVAEHAQPVTKIAQAKPAPVPQPAKPVVAYHHPVSEKPVAPSRAAFPVAVTRIQHAPTVAIAKPGPVSKIAPPAAAETHSSSFWTPPATIDPVQQAADPAPRDEHLEKLFRTRNGTHYDPTSSVDRRKMEQIKHGLVGKTAPAEHSLKHGADGALDSTQF